MVARKQIIVCDVCERVGRGTDHYRITTGGKRYELELCSEHAAPLRSILEAHEPKRPRRFEDTITTMEEIERRKLEKQRAAS